MPKNRAKTRANKKIGGRKKPEQALDRKNSFGKNDPTPYEAVRKIMSGGKEV